MQRLLYLFSFFLLAFLPAPSYSSSEPWQRLSVNSIVTVAKDGSGNFTSIADAVSYAPTDLDIKDGYYVINVKKGLYEENVVIRPNTKNLMLIGEGIGQTVVAANRSEQDGWSLMDTATFIVLGDRFVAMNMTFKNTAGPERNQAIALSNSADRSTFYHCSFEGYQDTLYVHSSTQFYRDCDIYGNMDFIFGNAAAVLQNCNIYVRRPPDWQHTTVITAQGRDDPNQNTGIILHGCSIRNARDFQNYNLTENFLGRPWRQYSRTVYMQSYIGDLIDPVGWKAWNDTSPLDKLFYAEFNNHGPGADTSKRVTWPGYHHMNASEALDFTADRFINANDWVPTTIVPLSTGLL